LRRDPDRVVAFFWKAGIIDHQKRIYRANDPVRLQRKLGLKRNSIPKAIGNEMVQAVVLFGANRSAIGSILLRSPGPMSPET
jgi:hypothetical protein